MAVHASDSRVRRKLVGGEFRVHHAVTKLSTELHGIGELISPIAADHAQSDEHDREAQKKSECATLSRIVEINAEVSRSLSGHPPSASPVRPNAYDHQQQPKEQKSGRHHVGEDAHIRAGTIRCEINEK